MKIRIIRESEHTIEIKKDASDRVLLTLYSAGAFASALVGLWTVLSYSELTTFGTAGLLPGIVMFMHAGITTMHRCINDYDICLRIIHNMAILNDRYVTVDDLKEIRVISSLARFGHKRYRVGLVDCTGHVFYLVWFCRHSDAEIILTYLKGNLNIKQVQHDDILSYRLADVSLGFGAWKKKSPSTRSREVKSSRISQARARVSTPASACPPAPACVS